MSSSSSATRHPKGSEARRGEERSKRNLSMAMDQELPLGLDEFSIAMDASSSLASLWPPTPLIPPDLHPYQESVEEVKRRLAVATAELEAAREEARRKEQSIAALVELVRRTAEERDQLRQHLLLARELAATATSSSSTDSDPILPSFSPAAVSHFEASSAAVLVEDNRSTVVASSLELLTAANRPMPQHGRMPQRGASSSSGPIVTSFYPAAVDRPALLEASSLAVVDKDKSTVPSFSPAAGDRPALLKASSLAGVDKDKSTAMPVINKDKSTAAKSTAMAVDRGEVVLEQLAAKRPLPQRGRLLQAVMEAGPLLENLLVAGPVPRWRNPPPVQPVPSPVIPAPSGSRAPMGWGPW